MPIDLTLISEKIRHIEEDEDTVVATSEHHLVSPGDVITRDVGYMRGHGTYTRDEVLYASVAGVVQRVNKLISVTPPKTKYQGGYDVTNSDAAILTCHARELYS